MSDIIHLALIYFFKILLVLNVLYLVLIMLQNFEFYRQSFFIRLAGLIYLILSPIYQLIDKTIDKTIFSEGRFYKSFKVIAVPFILGLILMQVYMFIEASYLSGL